MRRPRVRTVVLAAVIVLAAIVGGALVALRTARVHEWLRTLAVARLSALVDGDVEMGRISGSLLHDVAVEDVRIRRRGDVVIAAARIEARYDPLDLLRGRWQFAGVRVVSPDIHAVEESDGWNLAHLTRPRPGAGAASLALVLRDVRIENGRVRIDARDRPSVVIDHVSAAVTLLVDRAGVDVSVDHVNAREAASGDEVAVTGDVAFGDAGTVLRQIRLVATGLDLQVSGALRDGRVSGLDARAALRAWRGAPLRAIVPAVLRVPTLTGQVSASGASDGLIATWTLDAAGRCASTGRARVDVTRTPLPVAIDVSTDRCDPGILAGPAWSGLVRGRASASGVVAPASWIDSAMNVTFSGGPVSLLGYDAEQVSAKGTLRDRAMQVHGRARAYGAAATFDIDAPFDAAGSLGPFTMNGDVSHVDTARLPFDQARAFTTDLSGAYVLAVTHGDWQVQFTAAAATGASMTLAPGTIVRAAGTGSRLAVDLSGRVQAAPAAFEALKLPVPLAVDGQIDAHATLPDVHAPFRLSSLAGTARGSLNAQVGTISKPVSATFDVAIDDAALDVRSLSATAAASTLSAQGPLALDATTSTASQLVFDVNAPDLSALSAFGVSGLRGMSHASGSITGPGAQWRVDARVSGQQIGYGDRASALAATVTIRATVPTGDWAAATGAADLDASFIEAAGQQIPHAAMTASYARDAVEIAGQVAQSARAIDFSGTLTLPSATRELQLRAFTVSGLGAPWRLAGNGGAVLRLADGTVEIRGLTFARGGERLTAAGTVATAATSASDLTLDLSALNVGDLSELATGTRRLEGTADGHVHLVGTFQSPAGDAELHVHDARVSGVVVPTADATVHAADRIADLQAHLTEQSGAAFDVAGRVPIASGAGEADLRVTSNAVSLALLDAATTVVTDVHGTAAIDLHVTGPFDALDLGGSIHTTGAGFRVAATGVAYSGLDADVQLDHGFATIAETTVTDADGQRATISGRASLRAVNGARALEATIRSDGIHVLDNDLGDVEINAALDVSGSVTAPRVTGHVQATKARLEVDEILRALGATDVTAPAPPPPSSDAARALTPPAPPSPAKPPEVEDAHAAASSDAGTSGLSMSIDLRMPDNVVLRGQNLRLGPNGTGLGDMNITVGGTVTLRQRPGSDAVVVGAVEAVRGFYEFQGRRFTVTRGSSVQFRGARPINPSLDVTGERDVSGITARVRVTGTARRPALALSSQPPLDQGDILALIVFNQPLNELGESQQVDLLQRAGDMALGAIASSLTQSIGHALDVDLFEVRAPSGSAPGELNVGTQLGDRVFVGFRQQFGSSDASRLSIEYRITEALRLLTSFGQGQNTSEPVRDREAAGADLVYTIKY